MTRQVSLLVNDQPITLDYFVQGFIEHTTRGLLAGLEGTGEFGEMENAQISVRGEVVDINVDNRTIPTNAFVGRLVKSTLAGMVTSLKGVTNTNTFNIIIKKS